MASGNYQKDPWIFNYRTNELDELDSDDDSGDAISWRQSEESRLWSELDISKRRDTATFKPNPFTIAKINAIARASATLIQQPHPLPEPAAAKPLVKPGTIESFFRKTKRKVASTKKQTVHAHRLPAAPEELRNTPATESSGASNSHPPSSPTTATPSSYTRHAVPNPSRTIQEMHIPTTCSDDHLHPAHLAITTSQRLDSYPVLIPSPVAPSNHLPTRAGTKASVVPRPLLLPKHAPSFNPLPSKERPRIKEESTDPLIVTAKSPSHAKRPVKPLLPNPLPELTLVTQPKFTPIRENRLEDVSKPLNGRRMVNYIKPSISSSSRNPPRKMSVLNIKASPCYDFGKNDDESWSTLPPPKKKFKPRFLLILLIDLLD
ncbi:hypothetical protein AN958_02206 [Leucoagaricus sp. SymC.cos]|nr:hypothetical protein AN958_02206 [Leucoagaricus sp. SymC.cos]